MHNSRTKVVALALGLALGFVSCKPVDDEAVAIHVWDANQQAIDPASLLAIAPTVFIFTRTDCPISNRYAPTVRGLHEEFEEQGVQFFLIYADSDATDEVIAKHIGDFAYPCSYLRDPEHVLVRTLQAKVTPEVFVVTHPGTIHYRGRINDRFVDFGKERAEASTHDLKAALTAVLNGEAPPVAKTEAIGCRIPTLGSP